MSPEEFIKKHITDTLVSEGFPLLVAEGGQNMALIITGECPKQAVKGGHTTIVCSVPASGLSVRRQRQNGKRVRKRPGERVNLNPAYSDLLCNTLSTEGY